MGFINKFSIPKLLAENNTAQNIRRIVQEGKFLHGDINTLGERLTSGVLLSKEPQRSYQFELQVIDNNGMSTGGNDIKYFVKSIDFPVVSKEMIDHNFLDTKMSYSGKDSSPHNFTITFWDDEALTITDYMKKWYELSGDSKYNDSVNKESYRRTIKIKLLDVTGIISTGEFTLFNCNPIELGTLNLSYDDSNVLEQTITFYYDYYELSGMTR